MIVLDHVEEWDAIWFFRRRAFNFTDKVFHVQVERMVGGKRSSVLVSESEVVAALPAEMAVEARVVGLKEWLRNCTLNQERVAAALVVERYGKEQG